MHKPTPISGFPEYSPKQTAHLLSLIAKVNEVFRLHGFSPIDTPVVEREEVLLSKGGDADKELYLLKRRDPNATSEESDLGLRFDLTVPLARYAAMHFNDLPFPFKRSHVGPCFRGERPQEGRFRQFIQADIDVLNVDSIPLQFDIEIPSIIYEALMAIEVTNFRFRISNRKVLTGALLSLQIENTQLVTRVLDKIEKIGRDQVIKTLTEENGLSSDKAEICTQLAEINSSNGSIREQVQKLGLEHDLLSEGLDELDFVLGGLHSRHRDAKEVFTADLSITRGFDYYTGSVFEVAWLDHPSLGTISGGGRYGDLASSFIRKNIPGVGMSLGISRIFSKLVKPEDKTVLPEQFLPVLITRLDRERPNRADEFASILRKRGIAAEVYPLPDKIQKQLKYANRRGSRYVVFDSDSVVKDMVSGEQVGFDPEGWVPG